MRRSPTLKDGLVLHLCIESHPLEALLEPDEGQYDLRFRGVILNDQIAERQPKRRGVQRDLFDQGIVLHGVQTLYLLEHCTHVVQVLGAAEILQQQRQVPMVDASHQRLHDHCRSATPGTAPTPAMLAPVQSGITAHRTRIAASERAVSDCLPIIEYRSKYVLPVACNACVSDEYTPTYRRARVFLNGSKY